MADSGILNEQQLKGMAEQVLKAGGKPHSYKHLGPNYYMKYFRGRSQQDPNELDKNGQEQHSNELDFAKRKVLSKLYSSHAGNAGPDRRRLFVCEVRSARYTQRSG